MKVRFLNLAIPQDERKELLAAADAVFTHGQFINGPELALFEQQAAQTAGRRFAVGVSSGTDALYLALRTLGIGQGDEVITTSLSWIATANAISLTGAQPVFADINNDLNISAESIERLITPRTKAVVVVHYTGKTADMDAIKSVTDRHNILLVEDAAQAFSAQYKGKPAGSLGDIASFSFNPMKVLAACGEAGAVVTDKESERDYLESLRYGGTVNREVCLTPSVNARMDTVQAAFLSVRLKKLDDLIKKRRKNAERYRKLLKDVVTTPQDAPDCYDVYYTFTIQTDKRNELMNRMTEAGVETKIQHPILMPLQKIYSGCRAETENAEKLVEKILCLPIHEKLTDDEIDYTAENVIRFFRG